MNGQPGAHISEHAFGNALDIAGIRAGRRPPHRRSRAGWNGSPEEQGFLRDVQASACDIHHRAVRSGFQPVHYDHIHVD